MIKTEKSIMKNKHQCVAFADDLTILENYNKSENIYKLKYMD